MEAELIEGTTPVRVIDTTGWLDGNGVCDGPSFPLGDDGYIGTFPLRPGDRTEYADIKPPASKK